MMKESHDLLPKENKRASVCKVCGKEGDNSQIVKHVEADHLEGVAVHCNHCGERNARNQHKLLHRTYK